MPEFEIVDAPSIPGFQPGGGVPVSTLQAEARPIFDSDAESPAPFKKARGWKIILAFAILVVIWDVVLGANIIQSKSEPTQNIPPGGVAYEQSDGSTIYRYGDGREITVDLDGTVEETKPGLGVATSSIPKAARDVGDDSSKGYEEHDFYNLEQRLPGQDKDGNPIRYKTYDVNPRPPGASRDRERVIIGSDGKRYYTSDHYDTFTEF